MNIQASRFQTHGEEFYNSVVEGENRLYDYQKNAIMEMHTHYNVNNEIRPFLIVAPTGSGKSGIIAMTPFVLKSEKVFVLTPSKDITYELRKAFGDVDPENSFYRKVGINIAPQHGRVQQIRSRGEFLGLLDDLVVTNAQKFGGNSSLSLSRNMQEILEAVVNVLDQFSTLIVDEAHHFPAPTWSRIVNLFYGKQIIFLTATPYRYDAGERRNLYDLLDMFCYRIPRVGTIRTCHFEESRSINPDYIIRILNEHDELEPTIKHKSMVFVRTYIRARELSENWNRNGVITTLYTSVKETWGNLNEFENNNNIRILFVCGRLLEGYNNPGVSVCVILRKLTRGIQFNQFVGRCLRKSNDNDPVEAQVLSTYQFKQREMWNLYTTEGIAVPENDETDDSQDED